jgi:hypothetical protein
MARGGGTSSGAGGIMGSGVFGFFGTTIQCPASDTSFYCSFMKLFNLIMVLGLIIFILYTAYNYFRMNRTPGGKRR